MSYSSALLGFLRKEGVDARLVREIEAFRQAYPAPPETASRIPGIKYFYYGTEVWEQAITAVLSGENLLLSGPKATGKNVLAENLAAAFGRPSWDISFYANVDAASLIGTDTLEDGRVVLRRGPVSECAVRGGSEFWMKSTWRRTSRWPCCTPPWISAALSTCPATTRSFWTMRRALSPR